MLMSTHANWPMNGRPSRVIKCTSYNRLRSQGRWLTKWSRRQNTSNMRMPSSGVKTGCGNEELAATILNIHRTDLSCHVYKCVRGAGQATSAETQVIYPCPPIFQAFLAEKTSVLLITIVLDNCQCSRTLTSESCSMSNYYNL